MEKTISVSSIRSLSEGFGEGFRGGASVPSRNCSLREERRGVKQQKQKQKQHTRERDHKIYEEYETTSQPQRCACILCPKPWLRREYGCATDANGAINAKQARPPCCLRCGVRNQQIVCSLGGKGGSQNHLPNLKKKIRKNSHRCLPVQSIFRVPVKQRMAPKQHKASPTPLPHDVKSTWWDSD